MRDENTKTTAWAFEFDPDFQNLLPAAGEFSDQQLKELILKDGGVKTPLTLWKRKEGASVLIDGYRRVAAVAANRAEGHEIPDPPVRHVEFGSKLTALQYAIQNQDAARPNWNDDARALHILKNKTLRAEIERLNQERMLSGTKALDGLARKGGTLTALAQLARVSRSLVSQWDRIIRSDAERGTNWVDQIAEGNLTRNKAYQRISQLDRDEAARAALAAPLPLAPENDEYVIDTAIVADAAEGLKHVAPESVTLTITSPPYPHASLGYPHKQYQGYDHWLAEMRAVFTAVFARTKDGGRLVINIDNVTVPREEDESVVRRNSAFDLYQLLMDIGWVYRDTIIWSKGHAPATHPLVGSRRSPRFQRTWEELLIFHKGSRELDGHGYTASTDDFNKWTGNGLWNIQPETQPRGDHPYPFPEELPRRLIHLLSYHGDVVLDPFAGSGTTIKVAAELKRHYVGIDSNPAYVRYALARVGEAAARPSTGEHAIATPLSELEQGTVASEPTRAAAAPRLQSPLTYYGGKRTMARRLIEVLPPHHTYVELFGGSGALLFAKPRSGVEVYNDLDQGVVNLFRVMREHPQELQRRLALTPFSRDEFKRAKEMYETTTDPIERARLYFVLIGQSYGSIFMDAWGWGRTRDRTIPNLRRVESITLAAQRLMQVQIENDTFEKIITRYDTEQTVFFADPPYLAATRKQPKRYTHEMTTEQHRSLLERLCAAKGGVILTGYANPLYDRALRDWDRQTVSTFCPVSRRGSKRETVIWTKPMASAETKRAA